MSNQAFKPTILVTGANGQLGSELNIIAAYEPYQFIFTDIDELDLTNGAEVNSFFNTHRIDFCINCPDGCQDMYPETRCYRQLSMV